MPFGKGRSQSVGIDIGAYSIKIVGVRSGPAPKLIFHSLTSVPGKSGNPDPGFMIEAVMRVLREHGALRADASILIHDESLHVRRIELPHMPQREIRDALGWQIKDRLPFGVEKAALDFRIIGTIQREHNARVFDIMYVALLKEALEAKIAPYRKAGLSLGSVGIAPLAYEHLLGMQEGFDQARSVVIVDIGHAKTDISFYRHGMLQFVRTIPFSSGELTAMLSSPLIAAAGKIELTPLEAEEVKRQVGIPYEPMRLEQGISSVQVLTLIRGSLERFSKEVKRSIEYYTSEVAGEGISSLYLAGGGSNLKNIDRYLGEELGLPVKRIKIPKRLLSEDEDIPSDISVVIAGALGAALDGKRMANLLPAECRVNKIEEAEKISVRLLVFAAAIFLVFSFFVVKLKVDDYGRRVSNAVLHKGVLAQVRPLVEEIDEKERLIAWVRGNGLDPVNIMKALSNVIPKQVRVAVMKIDPQAKSLELSGVVSAKSGEAGAILTGFMEYMERSRYFKDAALGSIQEEGASGAAASSFSINCQLE